MRPSNDPVSSRILNTYSRINPHRHETRFIYDETLNLWLKCEHEQKTGSFKWRGALAKLSTLSPNQTIVTASTGNHGLAVANAAKIYYLSAKIFIPQQASAVKLKKISDTGAEIIKVEGDSLDAELAGKKFAREHDLVWVSPYNDIDVIAGQGTIGLELDRQLNNIDRIYITVGGGGLVSGIASWMKHHHPHVEIVGCQPMNSREIYLSIQQGHVVNDPDAKETLSDGSAGPLEEDSITFPICKQLIDRFLLISEDEIKDSIKYLYQTHQMIVEGAAAVAMAAARKEFNLNEAKNAVVILCGGNIAPDVHRTICS